ncbi:PilT protein-like [hydrothermal vent metagenome]|uniref:PilT protein-like n=1 Tax=hydrothermal vent metagenome TaxID=652676 RepID=A0A3B0XDC5_9ZZZZ
MIAIDTNIIIRFLTHDNERQYKKAFSVFNSQEIFIPDTVILETEWVLRYAYSFSPEDICRAFTNLFGLKNIHLSNPTFIVQAIEWHKQGMDFSDALHLTQCQQYEKLYTFDKSFSSKSKNLTQCSVISP